MCRASVRLTRREEAAEALRCLHETLRDSAFAGILVGLVTGKCQAEETDPAEHANPWAANWERNDS